MRSLSRCHVSLLSGPFHAPPFPITRACHIHSYGITGARILSQLEALVAADEESRTAIDAGQGGGNIGLAANRVRRRMPKKYVGCSAAESVYASLQEPDEEPGTPVSFVAGGATVAEVQDAVAEARLPWWDLSRVETAAIRGTSHEARPCRFISIRWAGFLHPSCSRNAPFPTR